MAAFKLKGTVGTLPEWQPTLWPSEFRKTILNGQAVDGAQSGAFKFSQKTADVHIYEYTWDTLPKADLDAFEAWRINADVTGSLTNITLYDDTNQAAATVTVRLLPDSVDYASRIGTLRDGLVIRLVKV